MAKSIVGLRVAALAFALLRSDSHVVDEIWVMTTGALSAPLGLGLVVRGQRSVPLALGGGAVPGSFTRGSLGFAGLGWHGDNEDVHTLAPAAIFPL